MLKKVLLSVLFSFLVSLHSFAAKAPAGWSFQSYPEKNYTLSYAKGAGQNGNEVPLIASVKKGEKGFATLTQTIAAGKFAGQRIRVSGYIKAENLNRWATLWVTADQNPKAIFPVNAPLITGTANWKKFERYIDVPANATYISYGFGLWWTGKIWIDNVTIEIVGPNVEPPLMPMLTAADTFAGQKSYAPIDMGFENAFIDTFVGMRGWTLYSMKTPSDTAFIDKGAGLEGTDALCMKSVNPKGRWEPEVNQFFVCLNYAGKKVKLTGYLKQEDINNGAGLYVSQYVSTDTRPVRTDFKNAVTKKSEDWVKCELTFDVQPYKSSLIFGPYLFGSGHVWVDNLSFEVVGESNDITANRISEPTNLNLSVR